MPARPSAMKRPERHDRSHPKVCPRNADRSRRTNGAEYSLIVKQREEAAMTELKIVAMATETAQQVRTTLLAPMYGFPAHRQVAAGRAPCRHCLHLIQPQTEELILFTYDAFSGQGVAPSPGPVYVHAEQCEAFRGSGKIPSAYLGQPLTFEAFGAGRKRLAEKTVAGCGEDQALQTIFADAEVKFVHVRSTSAGCYLFRVERA